MGHTVTDEEPLLFSAKLAAKALGISEMQVKHLVEDGRLPATRIKNRMFIPSASIREYVESVRRTA